MSKKKDIDNEQGGGVTLEDFIVPAKVDAFINHYAPAANENTCEEVFTDAKLRQFFKAWPCTLGDPLSVYMERLRIAGFTMGVSIGGEPALFVNQQEKQSSNFHSE